MKFNSMILPYCESFNYLIDICTQFTLNDDSEAINAKLGCFEMSVEGSDTQSQ